MFLKKYISTYSLFTKYMYHKWHKRLKESSVKQPQIKPRTANTMLYINFISIKKQTSTESNVTITEKRIQGKFYQQTEVNLQRQRESIVIIHIYSSRNM